MQTIGRFPPLAALTRGAVPVALVVAVLVLVGACSARPSDTPNMLAEGGSFSTLAERLDIGTSPRRTDAAAMRSGKHDPEREIEGLTGATTGKSGKPLPGPDDWGVITESLALFRHAPYVTDLVLGLLCSIGVALALTATPNRAGNFDPVARAATRKATVICALIGCIAAELVQASEQFLLGAEIALVLFGIGGLVRFRTLFDDASQTGVAIVSAVLGLACGMSEYSLVALSLVVVFLANWWMNSRACISVRIKVRKHADLAQVQSAVTALLQEQHFTVLRATPNSTERLLEVFAETTSDFDVEVLASSIQAAVPGARVRIRTS